MRRRAIAYTLDQSKGVTTIARLPWLSLSSLDRRPRISTDIDAPCLPCYRSSLESWENDLES